MLQFEQFPFFASFVAGIVTFVSPCILPLIPAFISFIAGTSFEDAQNSASSSRAVAMNTVFFVAGFSIVFILMGASASYLGTLVAEYRDIIRLAGGIVVIIFGLHISGIISIPLLYREKRIGMRRISAGYFGSFMLGVAFSIGWTPCVGPILASILILASAQETVYRGMLLLAVYSAGLAIPFLLTALFIERALRMFAQIKKYFKAIEISAGAILILLGILLITNRLEIITGRLMGILGN